MKGRMLEGGGYRKRACSCRGKEKDAAEEEKGVSEGEVEKDVAKGRGMERGCCCGGVGESFC